MNTNQYDYKDCKSPSTQDDTDKQRDDMDQQDDIKLQDDTNFKLVKSQFKEHFAQSFKSLSFYFLFSFAKYLACYWCLKDRGIQCEVNPLSIWLSVVGMYEFLNSIRYLTILYSLYMNSKDTFLLITSEFIKHDLKLSINDLQSKDIGPFINKRNQLKVILKMQLQKIDTLKIQADPPFSSYEIIYQAEALNKYTKLMGIYNQSVFYLVFIGGNVAYMASESNDCDQNIQNVTFALLLIGYLFSAFLIVGFGIALLSMGLYIPVVISVVFIKYVTIFIKKMLLRKKCRSLVVFRYQNKSDQLNQCLICMIDYVEGEQVLQLKCHSKHNFHHQCIQKWFVIKQQCPVCRKDL